MDISSREKEIYKVTLVGSVVNVLLTAIKFLAGIFGKSSAMIADAVHSLSDLVTDFIVIIFVRLSSKPEDSDHTYGHGKYETFASLMVGVMLAIVGIGIFYESVVKIIAVIHGEELPGPNYWALGAAILSIVSKEVLYRYTVKSSRKLDSPALEANAWHHRSDALTSLATLAGIAGAMWFGRKGRILDPLAAAIVSAFIVQASWSMMKPSIGQLLDKAVPDNILKQIEALIIAVPGVDSFHHLRTRYIGNKMSIEMHIKMDGDMKLREAHDVATAVEQRLREFFGKGIYINIHMEPTGKRI